MRYRKDLMNVNTFDECLETFDECRDIDEVVWKRMNSQWVSQGWRALLEMPAHPKKKLGCWCCFFRHVGNDEGKGEISKVLGSAAAPIEEAKADVMGVWNMLYKVTQKNQFQIIKTFALVLLIVHPPLHPNNNNIHHNLPKLHIFIVIFIIKLWFNNMIMVLIFIILSAPSLSHTPFHRFCLHLSELQRPHLNCSHHYRHPKHSVQQWWQLLSSFTIVLIIIVSLNIQFNNGDNCCHHLQLSSSLSSA